MPNEKTGKLSDEELKKFVLKNLFVNSQDKFKNDYYPTLLEQYKIYVQMTDNLSERRNKNNTFFLSINSFLLTLLVIFTKLQSGNNASGWIIIPTIGGAAFAFFWFRLIRYYRKLDTDKHKVIQGIESQLPIAPYETEFEMVSKHEKHTWDWKIEIAEAGVPIVFIGLYGVLSVITLLYLR